MNDPKDLVAHRHTAQIKWEANPRTLLSLYAKQHVSIELSALPACASQA